MQKDIEITIVPHNVDNQAAIKDSLAKALNVSANKITSFKILKRSIDARSRKVVYRMQVRAFINEDYISDEQTFKYPKVSDDKKSDHRGRWSSGFVCCVAMSRKRIETDCGRTWQRCKATSQGFGCHK
jgi:uncharacterized FAD-dependent dehydrogenase